MTSGNNDRSRFPYLPLFVDDWLSSNAVESFTLEQQGAYLRLLLRQWKARDGRLPKDELALARISGLGARWAKVGRPILRKCFIERDGAYINEKLRIVWQRTAERSAHARESADRRWELERKRKG